MLIKLSHHLPYDKPRTERLFCLEAQLRRKSDGTIVLGNYIEWLKKAGITIPTRRTLNEDLKRYANFCDDIFYGGESKSLSLNPAATRDAVTWLMGSVWLDSPLRPKLSSSCIRCLLLAKEFKAEVDFPYNPLRKPGEPWIPNMTRGIPLRFIPGADSGYMQLQREWGGKSNINLARVQRYVQFTANSTQHYAPLREEKMVGFVIENSDKFLLERLRKQFPNFVVTEEKHQILLQVEKSLAVMTMDMLKAHLTRTQTTDRRIPSKQQVGNTIISYHEL